MAIWSKKSKTPVNQPLEHGGGMIGGLSVDAHPSERRMARAGSPEDMTVGDYMTGMPTIRLTSLFKGLMKQILWVVPVFLLGCGVIYMLTKDIKRSYRAEGRLLVQIGPEYIYRPIGVSSGSNNPGVSQTPDTIALNEVGIMKNAGIIDDVIGVMTSKRQTISGKNLSQEASQNLFNEIAYEKIRKEAARAKVTGDYSLVDEATAKLHKFVNEAYYVAPQPKSSLIDVSFKHEDPEVAVESLNLFIEIYGQRRKKLFLKDTEDAIAERLKETKHQLKINELAISRFLERHDISDFTSEQDGLRERSEALKAELNTLRGSIAETEGSLARVEDQLRGTEPTINLYVDDRASQRVAQAELELKQLLAKYLPSSDPVRQKRTELNELKSLQGANNGRAAGGRRVGPNPNYQELVTSRNTLQATANSYREKEVTLQRQLNNAVEKVRRLTKLSPELLSYQRERETLSAAVDTYTARAQEAEVNLAQEAADSENIKVISQPESAAHAIKGQNTGKLIWAGGSMAWGLTLLMIALLIVFLNPKNFQAPGTVRSGPRRSRSTDGDNSNDRGSDIPEPMAPYEPRMPMTASLSGEAVAATRAYNASEKAVRQESHGKESHVPAAYDPSTYQAPSYEAVNYQEDMSYEAPQGYFDPSPAPVAQEQSLPQLGGFNMEDNPYLNMQAQTNTYAGASGSTVKAVSDADKNALAVLGSFSASKG